LLFILQFNKSKKEAAMIFIRNQRTNNQQPDEAQSQHWTHLAEALAKRWEALTVADLAQIQHSLSRLAEIVQERYQLTLDEARHQVAQFEQSLADEAKQAYAALGATMLDLKLRGSKLRHDISEFGWQVTAEKTIARYPGYAVGIAIVLGFIIGGSIGAATRRPRRW
jgi:hypothetical protein